MKTRIAGFIREAVEQRERFLTEVQAARQVIQQLPEMQEAVAMCSERRARCIVQDEGFPTLGAWNFASAGTAKDYLRRKWRVRVADLLEEDGLSYGLRFTRIPCSPPFGHELLSQRDIFAIRPVGRRIAHPGIGDNYLFGRPGMLVLAARGSLAEGELFCRPMLVTRELTSYALTEDLLRVVPKQDRGQLLYAYLSTLVGFRLLRSTAVGTKILNLRLDLVGDLPCPEIASPVEALIRQKIDAAGEAKARATEAEAEAVRIIEQEVLPAWLS